MCLRKGSRCSVLLNYLRPSAVVSEYLQNALLTQRLDSLHMTHQSQVTCSGLSYEAVFFSYKNVTWDDFHCANRFAVVQEEGPAEGLFEKEPDPPPPDIHNSTAPLSAPGDPIEADVFNTSNQTEDISLVRNHVLEFYDDI